MDGLFNLLAAIAPIGIILMLAYFIIKALKDKFGD